MNGAPAPTARLPGARTALALLLAINLFNYIDRYVLAAVLPKVGEQFNVGKGRLGLLMSMFLVSYTVVAPLFGWLGDRWSRWKLIAVGVILWSLASGGTGLARDVGPLDAFTVMLLTRALIGVGEGAYGPVAPSLISDLFPVERRGGVMAWFYMAIPVGSALGFVLGGKMADLVGWRWAFYVVVPPGVLLGLLCLLMREPPRGAADAVTTHAPTARDAKVLLDIPSFVLNTLAMTAMTFAFGGVATWMPTYLYEREATYVVTPATYEQLRQPTEPGVQPVPEDIIARLGPLEGREFRTIDPFRAALGEVLEPAEVHAYRAQLAGAARDRARSATLDEVNGTVGFGGIVVVAGLVATLTGGYLSDRLRTRLKGAYFAVSGVGMLVGLPMYLLALATPLPLGWGFVFLAVFFLFFNTGPANTALANVAPPTLRASAFAVNILVIHLFGDVISPPIVGWIDDRASLREGLYFLAGPMLLSGLFWLWGTRYLDRDTAAAPTRMAEPAPHDGGR
jgi:MFS transporter, Spinster family, sphingosine-1-phosphate transporter